MSDTETVTSDLPESGVTVAEQPAGDAPERDPNRVYTQGEMDAIAAKIKKNERYRTRKEIEAYYQGRESVAAPKHEEQAPAPRVDQTPTRDQFDSYEAFLEAKAEHIGRRAAREERESFDKSQKDKAAADARAERITKIQQSTVEKYPDLAERAAAVSHITFSDDLKDAIAESEFGADLVNHLVSNPKDFERIAALSPSQAAREIGRLEARFEAAKPADGTTEAPTADPVKRKISSVPAPLNPVAAAAVTADREPSHDKPDEWRRWRDKQLQKKRA